MDVDNDEGPVRHLFPLDSIKIMGESIGIANLNDDAAVKLNEDLEYRLKEIIQDAAKFMRHSKNKKLTCNDIDLALKVKNIEPLYGFDTPEYIPFRHTSGGGKDLYFPDEKELSLLELVNTPLPRLPCDVTIRAHWLSVEGVQPVVPENPPPITVEEQRNEAIGSVLPSANSNETVSQLKRMKFSKKRDENISTEWSKLKPLQAHSLSLEQQLYYKEITDACMVGIESKWQEALSSLSTDPGLYQLLPQFTSFINEGIKINMAHRKLLILKHLVRMVGALLENSSLSLEKFLHELIPSLVSCLISKQVCMRPESEDQWTLRENAGKVLAKICKKYSNSVNNIQPRITRILSEALRSNNNGLAVHFGAICGLVELGQDVITSLVLPRLKHEGALIQLALGQQGKITETVAANRLQSLLLRCCAPVVLATRPTSDTVIQYQTDYGSLGHVLFNQVKTLRQNRACLQSNIAARVVGTTLKSPSATLNFLKNKPPPLNLSSPQMVSIRTNSSSKAQSPVIASVASAALQLVSQAAKSNPGTPTSVTPTSSGLPAVNLLSAVINSPGAQAVLAEHLSAALSGSNGGNNSPQTQPPKTASSNNTQTTPKVSESNTEPGS